MIIKRKKARTAKKRIKPEKCNITEKFGQNAKKYKKSSRNKKLMTIKYEKFSENKKKM
jgi:hypothetical protein